MSRTYRTTVDTTEPSPVQRGQRHGRPTTRRTGTRADVLAAELASYGYRTATDALVEA